MAQAIVLAGGHRSRHAEKGRGALLERHTAMGSEGEGGMGGTCSQPCQRDPSCFQEQVAEITATALVVKSKGKMTERPCVIFMLMLSL